MLYRADLSAALFQRSAARSIRDEVAIRLDKGLARQVDSLELVTKAGVCRLQRHVHFDAGVQTRTGYTHHRSDRMLLVRVEICVH
jgi:hypothetical protein